MSLWTVPAKTRRLANWFLILGFSDLPPKPNCPEFGSMNNLCLNVAVKLSGDFEDSWAFVEYSSDSTNLTSPLGDSSIIFLLLNQSEINIIN